MCGWYQAQRLPPDGTIAGAATGKRRPERDPDITMNAHRRLVGAAHRDLEPLEACRTTQGMGHGRPFLALGGRPLGGGQVVLDQEQQAEVGIHGRQAGGPPAHDATVGPST